MGTTYLNHPLRWRVPVNGGDIEYLETDPSSSPESTGGRLTIAMSSRRGSEQTRLKIRNFESHEETTRKDLTDGAKLWKGTRVSDPNQSPVRIRNFNRT